MAQFDVYENPSPRSRAWAPYLVDLQHDLLGDLNTRIMAPLVAAQPGASSAISRLNPEVDVRGLRHFLSTAEMASVPVSELGAPIDNLAAQRQSLLAAVDLLFTAI